jgi:hypothetical protein
MCTYKYILITLDGVIKIILIVSSKSLPWENCLPHSTTRALELTSSQHSSFNISKNSVGFSKFEQEVRIRPLFKAVITHFRDELFKHYFS